jgi:segregation and condensation protein A
MSDPGEMDMLAAASMGAEGADARNTFHVDLDVYEGPLHLLLELARRQKVDLIHISILKLADQYLAFVREARDKRIDLAADYLLMAAWLAFLKSKLLLPQETKRSDEPDGEEMAGRLAFQLARLDAMRHAVKDLEGGLIDGRDVFRRGMPQRAKVVRTPIWTTSLHDMMKAFGDINTRKFRARTHVVTRQPVMGLEVARRQLARLAAQLDDWCAVQDIHPSAEAVGDAPQKSVTASLFSAALELARDRVIDLRQDAPFRDVYVRRARAETPKAAE